MCSVWYLSLHFLCWRFMLLSLFPVVRYDLLPLLALFVEKLLLPLQFTLARKRQIGYDANNLQLIMIIRRQNMCPCGKRKKVKEEQELQFL